MEDKGTDKEATNQAEAERQAEETRRNLTAQSPEEQAELKQMLKDIKGQRFGTFPAPVRFGGLTLAGLTFVALAFLTMILAQDVPFETRVYGPKQLLPGSLSTYRIALFEPEKTRFLPHIRATLWLRDGKRTVKLFSGHTKNKVLIANIRVPQWKTGSYQLLYEVSGPNGEESAALPIQLVTEGKLRLRVFPETGKHTWHSTTNETKAYRYTLFTDGRGVISDLPNKLRMHIQVQTEPQPAPTPQPPATRTTNTQPKATSQPTSQPTTQPTPPTKRIAQQPPPTRTKTKPSTFGEFVKNRQPHRSKQALLPFAKGTTQKRNQRKASPKQKARQALYHTPNKPLRITIHDGKDTLGPFTTDSFGIATIPYMPQFLSIEWNIYIDGPHGRKRLFQRLKTEGYQLLLEPKRVLIPEGQPIAIRVDSLHRKGTMHFDIVKEGRRLWSTKYPFSGGTLHATLTPPKHITGLVNIQAYTEFYNQGDVYDSRLIYIGKATPQTLLRAVERNLSARGDGMRILQLDPFKKRLPQTTQFSKWARHLLAFAKARFTPPPVLYNSFKDKHKKLRNFQSKFRNRVLLTLSGVGGLVVFGMFGWMFWGYRRDQLAMQQAEREHEEIDRINTRGLPWLVGFAIVMLLIFGCVIYLFYAMKWTFDNL